MSKHSTSFWIIVLVFAAVLVMVVGGGLMGAVGGYYVANSASPVIIPTVPSHLASEKLPAPPTVVSKINLETNSAVIDSVKRAEPAVVTIFDATRARVRGFGTDAAQTGGSGVIIDAQGHIVTNAHVLDGMQQPQVIYFDGSTASARVVGTVANADITVLRVSGKIPAFISFGDSSALQLGEPVIAIGSPVDSYRGSVTVGVVSGLNRSVEDKGLNGMIQTDAAINDGDAGGPLLNLTGQVIGINTVVVRDTNTGEVAQGLGFAIASNVAMPIVQQLIAQEK